MSQSWQLQPIFGSYLLVAVLAISLLGLLLITPRFGQLSRHRKRWLIGLRSALAVLLALGMLRPSLVMTNQEQQQALLLVLFDASRSMDYRDGEGGKTRWDQQTALLRSVLPKLEAMGPHFAVELLAFSGDIQPQPRDNDRLDFRAQPTGDETDLGQAISSALKRHPGRRLAGMILISDGAQRAVIAETPPQQAARLLDRRATPLYTITLGRSRDQSQSRDVAIENLDDEYSIFVKNELALRVGVRIQGFANQPIPVTLFVEDDAGVQQKVATQQLLATQQSQVVMADFGYRPERAGKYRLRVQAEPQSGELIENNEAIAFLDVRDGGLRVLLLSSDQLSSEAKFIRWSLDEAQEIELDYQPLQLAQRASWPLDLSASVTLDDYDVFIVGDLDARAVRNADWERMAELVEEGRGFYMYGGHHSFGPGGYATTAISKLLPVAIDNFEREPDPSSVSRFDRHLEGDIRMLPVGDSPVTHLRPAERENRSLWERLKPMRDANKFDKLKDEAIVLAQSEDGQPLLVQGTYVAGRVLASAVDSTYRWWKYGDQEPHKRFWRQCILWLARRDKQQANSVFIELPQRRFSAGTRIQFVAGMTNEIGDVLSDVDLRATVIGPDDSRQEIALAPGEEGSRGLMSTDQDTAPGIYRLEVAAFDGTTPLAKGYVEFVVVKEDFELSDPAANPGLLDILARMTERVGGRSLAPEQLDALIDEIQAKPPENTMEIQSRWQLGDHWWDAWGSFLLLTSLLSIDWFLRKRWGLV